MNKIVSEYADDVFEARRLGRNGAHKSRDRVFAEMLAELEASGDAMRFINSAGRIAWSATAKCRQHLRDLELDAQNDLQDI